MSYLQLVVTLQLLMCSVDNAEIIKATSINSTGEWYINSERDDGHFQYDNIICSASNTTTCIIICDRLDGCYGTNINASASLNLIIRCLEQESCHYLNVSHGSIINVTIDCLGDKSCKGANFHLDSTVNTISITCNFNLGIQGYENGACIEAELISFNFYANNAKYINVYCGEYDCVNSNFYINEAYSSYFAIDRYGGESMYIDAKNMKQSLNIDCFGNNACYRASFNCYNMSSLSKGITLNCTNIDQTECKSTFISCPLNADCNCISCYDTTMYLWGELENEHKFNIMPQTFDGIIEFRCRNKETYFTYTDVVYNGNINNWECNRFSCCPYNNGIIDTCESDKECFVDCTIRSCINMEINATTASSLILTCNTNYNGCSGSKVFCPLNGSCLIICNGSSTSTTSYNDGVCDFLEVINSNTDSNNYASIDIQCIYGWQCEFIEVNAFYINMFKFSCDNSDCERNVFRIDYVKNVDIYCKDFDDNNKYLHAGCSYNIFNAHFAENVVIICDPSYDDGYGTCYSNEWYLPNKNVNVYCQDNGCRYMGDFYVINNVSNWNWYYKNCDNSYLWATSIDIHCNYNKKNEDYNTTMFGCRLDRLSDICGCKLGFSDIQQINASTCDTESDTNDDDSTDSSTLNYVSILYVWCFLVSGLCFLAR